MALRPRRKTRDQSISSEPKQRGGGEQLDLAAEESIRLAHRAINRFPDLLRRHRYVAGGAAVTGALVVLASVAIVRRMRHGESGEQAADSVTEAEIESLHHRERDDDEAPEVEDVPATAATVPGASNGHVLASNGAHTNGTNGATAHASETRTTEG
ncbi:MAG: hypothetical protein EXR66_01980 [Dehalococcoidia bacterium]|nr:hypothetical protein [Dehalococcoidia bacterium]